MLVPTCNFLQSSLNKDVHMEKELVIPCNNSMANKWKGHLTLRMDYSFYLGWPGEFLIGNAI